MNKKHRLEALKEIANARFLADLEKARRLAMEFEILHRIDDKEFEAKELANYTGLPTWFFEPQPNMDTIRHNAVRVRVFLEIWKYRSLVTAGQDNDDLELLSHILAIFHEYEPNRAVPKAIKAIEYEWQFFGFSDSELEAARQDGEDTASTPHEA